MAYRCGWTVVVALSLAATVGCERSLLMGGTVDSTDAGGGMDADPSVDGGTGCPVTQSPAGRFSFLSAGNGGTCGIHTDRTATCWGLFYYDVPTFDGAYLDVSRQGGVCAIHSSGALQCWGLPDSVGATPQGFYEQVVIAEDAVCARAGGNVSCWGHAAYTPPSYGFESLTGGAYYMCGLEKAQHAAVCWEPRVGAESVQTHAGPFAAVDTGRFFACGLRVDGSVDCWSTEWPGAPSPNTDAAILDQPTPAGPFRELSTGEFHACALDAAGNVTCWGDNEHGQLAVPPGLRLAHVSAGSTHTCGIQLDGTVVCWGASLGCE